MSETEISGVVTKVNKIFNVNSTILLDIQTQNEIIQCQYIPELNKYLSTLKPDEYKKFKKAKYNMNPVNVGDMILGFVDENNFFVRQPYINISVNEDNITHFLVTALKGRVNIEDLYSKLNNSAFNSGYGRSVDSVRKDTSLTVSKRIMSYLSDLSSKYAKTKDSEIVYELKHSIGLKAPQINQLLIWWYDSVYKRTLTLMGIADEMIENSNKDIDEISQICNENPYKIASIPINICSGIMISKCKKIDNEQVKCGEIVRIIYDNLKNKGWTSTPLWMLRKNFSDLFLYKDKLIQEYECVFVHENQDLVYLKYIYDIENYVCNFLNERIVKTSIEYKNFKKSDEEYILKTLTEEQKNAIQSTIYHRISILTGGPGTGKCFEKGTEILMFNGKIKKIEDIKESEIIMGEDSNPKIVLNTTQGRALMYEIRPSEGKSFTCNGEHILTLKGFEPFCLNKKNKYIIYYTKNGLKKKRNFLIKKEAYNFLNNLKEDIFDISVLDYLNLKNTKFMYLFHNSIKFPEQEVSENVYIKGYKGEIEKKYLINTEKIRLKLLAGLIDKYGIINNKDIEFDEIKLFKNLEFLSATLGYISSRKNNKLYISGNYLNKIPTLLKKLPSTYNNLTFSISEKEIDNYYGFELDGNGRFVLASGLVTHNSSVIKEIVNNLDKRNIKYVIASFTGKAVSRVNQILGKKIATTLDRIILSPFKEKFKYLIIDETSMVTIELFYRFIQKFKGNYKVIIIGDINQLQPIGWGCFMKEIMKCRRIPIYRLNTNHRIVKHNLQSFDNKEPDDIAPGDINFDRMILKNLEKMVNPQRNFNVPVEFESGLGFYLLDGGIENIELILNGLYNAHVDVSDICIFCPYNEYLIHLNILFQNIFLKNAKFINKNNKIWKIGDRVMMVENYYDDNVIIYHGDEGYIKSFEENGILVKTLDGEEYLFLFENSEEYNQLNINLLIHSFAITISSAQGSECKIGIVYNPYREKNNFLTNELFYVGLSRPKRVCYLTGNIEAIKKATTVRQKYKYDSLGCKLYKLKDKEKEEYMNNLTVENLVFSGEVTNNLIAAEYDDFDPDDF